MKECLEAVFTEVTVEAVHMYPGAVLMDGLRGLKPRVFAEKPRMFVLPCPVRIIITEFSGVLKSRTRAYSRQEPATEARPSD